MALAQGEQKRQRGERLLAPGEELDVVALAGVVAAVLLVGQAQLGVLVVEVHLSARYVHSSAQFCYVR